MAPRKIGATRKQPAQIDRNKRTTTKSKAPAVTKQDRPATVNQKRNKAKAATAAVPTRRSTRRVNQKKEDITIFSGEQLDVKHLKIYHMIEASRDAIVLPHDDAIARTKGVGNPDTYGELSYWFLTSLFEKAKLNWRHLFVDLGSGVGNAVLQAALEVGCTARGCEISKPRNDLATPFHADLLARCTTAVERKRLTNVAAKERVRFVEGDIFQHVEVGTWIPTADLILCANLKFSGAMNDELLLLAMQMKPGARMATLAPLFLGSYEPGEQSPLAHLSEERLRARKGEARWAWNAFDWYLYTKLGEEQRRRR